MTRATRKSDQDWAARDFEKHATSAGPGWSWLFRKPGCSAYYFRITWAPGILVCSGDIGELVVRHYSFDDPWSAASWINGAGFDYFMEKTPKKKEFDAEATARGIIEDAYRQMRDGLEYDCSCRTIPKLMKKIVEEHTYLDDDEDPDVRKEACRDLLSLADCGEFTADQAYDLTGDSEALRYDYVSHYAHRYMAFKKWGEWMWANEPLWHKTIRQWRSLQATRKSYRDYPIIWAPIRYVKYENGKPTNYNGHKFWRWHKYVGREGLTYSYRALRPWIAFGHDMTRFGFWRDQGSSTGDDGGMDRWGRPLKPGDGFRDVRPA